MIPQFNRNPKRKTEPIDAGEAYWDPRTRTTKIYQPGSKGPRRNRDDDMFVPGVPLDPSRITDKRNDPDILFWIGNWWYETSKLPGRVINDIGRQRKKGRRFSRIPKQYSDEANQPPLQQTSQTRRIEIPIPRATPQRRKL